MKTFKEHSTSSKGPIGHQGVPVEDGKSNISDIADPGVIKEGKCICWILWQIENI